MNPSLFICPVCASPLSLNAKSFTCVNKHSYDIAKEGYVNLLLANQKQSREPGDSKEMLEARKNFLNKGYYKPLARSVTSSIIKYSHRARITHLQGKLSYCQRHTSTGSVTAAGSVTSTFLTILDAGCGEGYYTDYISKNRYVNSSSSIYGIDISKEGIKSAAKRNSRINFAVAGIYNLPIPDDSVDIILNIFAPFNEKEFERVLKERGIVISVTPGAQHLYELKKNLYDEVYINDEEFLFH